MLSRSIAYSSADSRFYCPRSFNKSPFLNTDDDDDDDDNVLPLPDSTWRNMLITAIRCYLSLYVLPLPHGQLQSQSKPNAGVQRPT